MDGSVKDWMLRVVLGRDPEVVEHGPPPELHPDLIALDHALAEIRAAEPQPTILLLHHLRTLTHRGVRIVSVRPAPAELTARLHCADGSTILVRAEHTGILGAIALRLASGHWVRLSDVLAATDTVRLRLTTETGPVTVEAVGFDQAD